MSRIGFWATMLAAFLLAGGFSGYVAQTATSADAPAASVRVIQVYELTAGYYVVSGGAIVPFGQQPTPPEPTPDPTPDELTARAKAVKAAAEKATTDPQRETTAINLAMVYREVAKKIEAKSITGQELIQFAIKFGTDQLLVGKGSGVTKAWQPYRDVLSSEVARVINSGGSDADFVKLLNETADGLQASSPNALPQIDMEMVMAIIKLIMELIALFS